MGREGRNCLNNSALPLTSKSALPPTWNGVFKRRGPATGLRSAVAGERAARIESRRGAGGCEHGGAGCATGRRREDDRGGEGLQPRAGTRAHGSGLSSRGLGAGLGMRPRPRCQPPPPSPSIRQPSVTPLPRSQGRSSSGLLRRVPGGGICPSPPLGAWVGVGEEGPEVHRPGPSRCGPRAPRRGPKDGKWLTGPPRRFLEPPGGMTDWGVPPPLPPPLDGLEGDPSASGRRPPGGCGGGPPRGGRRWWAPARRGGAAMAARPLITDPSHTPPLRIRGWGGGKAGPMRMAPPPPLWP